MRREDGYVGQRVSKMVVGRRKRGRPARRWNDCVREDMKIVGVTVEDALDRKRWKRLIRTGDPRNGIQA